MIYRGPNTAHGRGTPSTVPAWRSAMAVNTWAEVPSTLLSSIDPANSITYNPNYPGGSPWNGTGGQANVVGAWNGAVFDSDTDTLFIPLAGGHTDYAGNEPYAINLRTDAPAWTMLRAPSGAVGNVITLSDGQEATGLYSDGRLRSVHSYSNHAYVPGLGPVITRVAAPYASAAGNVRKMYSISPITGEASLLSDWTAISGTDAGITTGAACYDSTRGCVWHLGGSPCRMLKMVVSTGVTTTVGVWDNHLNSEGFLIYIPSLDLIGVFDGYYDFRVFDPATGLWTFPTTTGSYSAGLSLTGQIGAAWDGSKIVIWNNATTRTEISTLTPPVTSPRTTAWTRGVQTVSGSNAITPTSKTSTGTRGRFGYSSYLQGCYLFNGASEKLYFFALA